MVKGIVWFCHLLCIGIFVLGCNEESSTASSYNSNEIKISYKVSLRSAEDGTPVLGIDCPTSTYTEIADGLNEMKAEDASLSSISIANVETDKAQQNTSFDMKVSEDQIKALASDSELVAENSTECSESTISKSQTQRGSFSKRTYCAIGTASDYKTIRCPNGKMTYQRREFKARCYVSAMATAIWYFPSGVSMEREHCPSACK